MVTTDPDIVTSLKRPFIDKKLPSGNQSTATVVQPTENGTNVNIAGTKKHNSTPVFKNMYFPEILT